MRNTVLEQEPPHQALTIHTQPVLLLGSIITRPVIIKERGLMRIHERGRIINKTHHNVILDTPNSPSICLTFVGWETQDKRSVGIETKTSVQSLLDNPVRTIALKMLQNNLGQMMDVNGVILSVPGRSPCCCLKSTCWQQHRAVSRRKKQHPNERVSQGTTCLCNYTVWSEQGPPSTEHQVRTKIDVSRRKTFFKSPPNTSLMSQHVCHVILLSRTRFRPRGTRKSSNPMRQLLGCSVYCNSSTP
jgi:hypothetical protein